MSGKKKRPDEPSQSAVVAIGARVYPQETMFLRVYVGEAQRVDDQWELSTNAADGSPMVRLPDRRWVTFSWDELVEAANAAGAKVADTTRRG
jgi:hypothetical protein